MVEVRSNWVQLQCYKINLTNEIHYTKRYKLSLRDPSNEILRYSEQTVCCQGMHPDSSVVHRALTHCSKNQG